MAFSSSQSLLDEPIVHKFLQRLNSLIPSVAPALHRDDDPARDVSEFSLTVFGGKATARCAGSSMVMKASDVALHLVVGLKREIDRICWKKIGDEEHGDHALNYLAHSVHGAREGQALPSTDVGAVVILPIMRQISEAKHQHGSFSELFPHIKKRPPFRLTDPAPIERQRPGAWGEW